MSSASISTTNLTIGYGSKVVQHDVSISLLRGEMVCLLGPNGCGKSTLLRTLSGLQPALAGSISFADVEPHASVNRARLFALVLTERLSMENTDVHDVVAMGRYPYTNFLGALSEQDEEVICRALDAVGMNEEMASRTFNSLSDGEKQRVLIAKAIAQQTPIILLDEPTAHLDLPNRIRTLQLLRRLAHEENKTILISTHELDLALRLSDRILLMSRQGVVLDTADMLREKGAFREAFDMDIFNPLCE